LAPRADVWAREPPSPWRPQEACLLVSCPVCDPIVEVASRATPRARCLRAPEPQWSRLVFLCLGLGWSRKPSRSQGPSSSVLSIRSLKPRQAPGPCAGATSCPCSARFLGRRVRASVLDGLAPEPPGYPRGVGRGSLRSGTIDPEA
jgi:hypothetical protein